MNIDNMVPRLTRILCSGLAGSNHSRDKTAVGFVGFTVSPSPLIGIHAGSKMPTANQIVHFYLGKHH